MRGAWPATWGARGHPSHYPPPLPPPISACRSEPASQLPQMGPEQGFFRFSTDAYVLHHLETPTGYKFALAADPQAGDLRGPLWTLYADIFTCYALKNPMYVPGSPILNAGFASAVEGFVKGLPGFGQKF